MLTVSCSQVVQLFLESGASLLREFQLLPGLVPLHHQCLLSGQCLCQLFPHAGCRGRVQRSHSTGECVHSECGGDGGCVNASGWSGACGSVCRIKGLCVVQAGSCQGPGPAVCVGVMSFTRGGEGVCVMTVHASLSPSPHLLKASSL